MPCRNEVAFEKPGKEVVEHHDDNHVIRLQDTIMHDTMQNYFLAKACNRHTALPFIAKSHADNYEQCDTLDLILQAQLALQSYSRQLTSHVDSRSPVKESYLPQMQKV